MSFKLMVQAFEARVGNPLRKLVLIKLADQANDNGVCWPSYETLAFHCETTRRSVITHVKQLEVDGFLRIERVYDKEAGKNKSNRYHLTIEKKVLSSGENNSLVKELHHPSENNSPPLVKELHHPSEGASPKPITESINTESINESVKSAPKTKAKKKVEKPTDVSNQVWSDFLELRKTKKAPLSVTAWNQAKKQVDQAMDKTGHSLEQVMTEWVLAGWTGFKCEWYLNRVGAKPQINRETDKLAVNNQWRQGESNIVEANTSIEDMFGGA